MENFFVHFKTLCLHYGKPTYLFKAIEVSNFDPILQYSANHDIGCKTCLYFTQLKHKEPSLHDETINTLLQLRKMLFYSYVDHFKRNRYRASVLQNTCLYVVIELVLKYGLHPNEISTDHRPSNILLTIFCHLFNKSITRREI